MRNIGGRVALFLVSLLLWGWVLLDWLPANLGDCMTSSPECLASKRYYPSLVLWRGLAIQLGLVVIYLLFSRPRTR